MGPRSSRFRSGSTRSEYRPNSVAAGHRYTIRQGVADKARAFKRSRENYIPLHAIFNDTKSDKCLYLVAPIVGAQKDEL